MPNWCSNELTIEGGSEEIKRFMHENTGLPARYELDKWEIDRGYSHPTEPRFCFNKLVPTPQAVLDLGYDGHHKLKKIAEERGQEAIAGMIDGYHWNIENWGTKWDIYGTNISLENCGWEEGMTELILYFDTAWSPPIAWLSKVAPMFPSLRFVLHFYEEGCFFAGDVVCKGESFSVDMYSEERCRELFGYDEEEVDEEPSAFEQKPSEEVPKCE